MTQILFLGNLKRNLIKKMVDFFIRNDCRLCNSKNLSSVIKLEETPPANAFINEEELHIKQKKYPLELFFCEECNHLQLSTVVDPKKLFEKYVYVSGTSNVFVKHFEKYAEFIIKRYSPSKENLIIDIGSNDGTLLSFFKSKGYKILGVDPAKKIAKNASEKGIQTIASFFNKDLTKKIIKDFGKASIITANNVFAHSNELDEIIDSAKLLLNEEGLFIFEVSYLIDVYEKSLFDTIYHEHLAYHSVKPLKVFFEKHNMELIDVKRIDTHGGSIRGVVQKKKGTRKIESSVDELIKLENNLGFSEAKTFKDFSNKISKIKEELKELLLSLKKEGKSIVGFGAPAKATTLMYQFGFNKDLIDFIVDDNPLKQNTFTPGLHIPVYSSMAIKQNTPDYILILAWNFAESIIKNHSYFTNQNGRFIIPLPQIIII